MSTHKPGYRKRYLLDQARGISHAPLPAARVRAHVNTLIAAGATYAYLSQASGLHKETIRKIVNGRKTVHRTTAAALLGVRFERITEHDGFVPATGAIRRIRALLALGHTYTTIAEAAGVDVRIEARSDRGYVRTATYAAVCRAYEVLSMTPGTNAHVRSLARGLGYPPPLAWDDDDLDDPYATPQDGWAA